MRRLVSLFLLLFISIIAVKSQNTGQWKEYLSTSNAQHVTESDSRIYCATEGGLFYLNRNDNSFEKITRSKGLSDAGVDIIKYDKKNQVLFITYTNSNIDLFFEQSNEIYNISDIKRKDILGDKSINNITFHDDVAYLSCGFGIVAVNLTKKEIKDTYIIGDDGNQLAIYNVAIKDQEIYAATQQGIKRVTDYQDANLLDYHVWDTMTGFPGDGLKTKTVLLFNRDIIANYIGLDGKELFYAWNGTSWKMVINNIASTSSILPFNDELMIASIGVSYVYNSNYERSLTISKYSFSSSDNPRCIIKDNDGIIWIADYSQGLVKINGETHEKVSPPGPASNSLFRMAANGDDLWIVKGGMKADWNNSNIEAQFQLKRNNDWMKWDKTNVAAFDSIINIWNNKVRDIVNIAVDPQNPNHIALGSWGSGVFEFLITDDKDWHLMNWHFKGNSPLENSEPHSDYTRCMGLYFDKQGNLYISNAHVAHNIHKLSPEGEWTSYDVDASSGDSFVGELAVLSDGNIWMLDRSDGLTVLNPDDPSQKRNLSVEALFTNAEVEKITTMNNVYSLAEDNDGALWVGTDKGIAVYHSPNRVFSQDKFYAYQPGLDLNDGLYHPLLEKETITTIAVDGANRKWCGTISSGVFLISENGEKELEHFTTENSPLLSNKINDIVINPNTGEVYLGTAAGLVSYMGDATESKKAYSNVFVSPNPVRETYHGDIIIKGLKENTEIKITDVAGNLVFETTSLGGQAIWDGRNSHGNRVSTGVYLVMGADANKTESFITKVLFIH